MKKAIIYFSNGKFFNCKSFGADGTQVGQSVFNTSMNGYQEITTDPSYAGQFIVFCMPEIGNVGVNDNDMESNNVFANAVIVRSYNDNYSNFRASSSLSDLLKKYNKMGICDLNTRDIVKMLRDEGALNATISTEEFDVDKLKEILKNHKNINDINLNDEVSTKESYIHTYGIWDNVKLKYNTITQSPKKKILVVDFGVKRNILNELVNANLEVEVIPYRFDGDEIIKRFENKEICGVFLSNGPGDPKILKDDVAVEIKKLSDKDIPMFGICFGHQLLSIAHGYDTYSLKFGHHGGNHPIINTDNRVEITAQNHLYNVPKEISEITDIIAKNLFDDTIEGVKYKNKKIFSIQYHPESSPGPLDSKNYFKLFESML